LHALLGFLPYEGEILINGQLLSRLDRRDWHAQVSYLAQQPELLPGTVADNLRLAAPDAGDDALIGALQEVGLWELLRRLPLQLETPLGERGLGLSGGQLSRLALARMLLRDTPVWLLDEPLAHLDPDTAQGIGALLARLSRGRTLILVSHEVTGLEWLQRRLVLEARHGWTAADRHWPAAPAATLGRAPRGLADRADARRRHTVLRHRSAGAIRLVYHGRGPGRHGQWVSAGYLPPGGGNPIARPDPHGGAVQRAPGFPPCGAGPAA